MPRIRSRFTGGAVSLALLACARGPQAPGTGDPRGETRGGSPLPTPAGQPVTAKSTANMTLKRVAGKEEPATLIAADRSECTVTADRYRKTSVGDNVLCDWRVGDRQP